MADYHVPGGEQQTWLQNPYPNNPNWIWDPLTGRGRWRLYDPNFLANLGQLAEINSHAADLFSGSGDEAITDPETRMAIATQRGLGWGGSNPYARNVASQGRMTSAQYGLQSMDTTNPMTEAEFMARRAILGVNQMGNQYLEPQSGAPDPFSSRGAYNVSLLQKLRALADKSEWGSGPGTGLPTADTQKNYVLSGLAGRYSPTQMRSLQSKIDAGYGDWRGQNALNPDDPNAQTFFAYAKNKGWL